VPHVPIIHYPALVTALANELRTRFAAQQQQRTADSTTVAKSDIFLEHQVVRIRDGHRSTHLEVQTPHGMREMRSNMLIACCGLYSDVVAASGGLPSAPQIVPFRGEYLVMRPEAAAMVRGLVYPVPDTRVPFLGVHFTRMLNQEVWLGPNAVLALAQEAYSPLTLNLKDMARYCSYSYVHALVHKPAHAGRLTMLFLSCLICGLPSGFQRLVAKHWRFGAAELYRSIVCQSLCIRQLRWVWWITIHCAVGIVVCSSSTSNCKLSNAICLRCRCVTSTGRAKKRVCEHRQCRSMAR
jgi:hypothetical protein